jgi:sodium-dependent phosphate cotransporter
MFNFLTVMVLLPLEYATSYLEILSDSIVTSILGEDPENDYEEEDLLKKITEPFTAILRQIDSGLITDIDVEENHEELERL